MKRDACLINVDNKDNNSNMECLLWCLIISSLSSIWPVCCTLSQSVSVLSTAVEDYQEAREFDQENQEIREGLERAQKLLKISRKRDYYKILGVSRYVHNEDIWHIYLTSWFLYPSAALVQTNS